MWRSARRLAGVLLGLFALSAGAAGYRGDLEPLARLRRATVTLEPSRCAGVVTQGEDGSEYLVTAAHCVLPEEQTLTVVGFDGRRFPVSLEAIHRETDVAVFSLPAQARLE